jgi:cytochrome c biogenesis factor
MDKLLSSLFSMRWASVGLIVFLVAIGAATFIESIHGIQAAKITIYNATWFEGLLLYLTLALVSNIFRYKMFSREKIAMLSFHLSFIVILAGAAVTRYISFEGQMVIREGASNNFIYTADPTCCSMHKRSQKQKALQPCKPGKHISANSPTTVSNTKQTSVKKKSHFATSIFNQIA